MFNLLLILHITAVCCWLGGAMYERYYIVGGIRKAKDRESETSFLKILLSTAPFFLTAVITVLITGIIMTIIGNYGFFQWSWIGLKQYIMVAILLVFIFYVAPQMGLLGKQLQVQMEQKDGINDEMRSSINRIVLLFDIMHLGVLVNVILGVTKFF